MAAQPSPRPADMPVITPALFKKTLKGLLDTKVDVHVLSDSPKTVNPGEVIAVDKGQYFEFYRATEVITDLTTTSLASTHTDKVYKIDKTDLQKTALSNPQIEGVKIKFDSPTGEKSVTLPDAAGSTKGVISEEKVNQLIGTAITAGVPDAQDTTAGKVTLNKIKELANNAVADRVTTAHANATFYSDAVLEGNKLKLKTPGGQFKEVDLTHFVDTLEIPSNLFKGAEIQANKLVFTKQDGKNLEVDLSQFVDRVPAAQESTQGTVTLSQIKTLAVQAVNDTLTSGGSIKDKLDALQSKDTAIEGKVDAMSPKVEAAVKTVVLNQAKTQIEVTTTGGTKNTINVSDLTKPAEEAVAGIISKGDIKSLIAGELGNKLNNAVTGGSYSSATHSITLTRNSGTQDITIDLSELYVREATNSDIFQ